jgi:hypothetical protein
MIAVTIIPKAMPRCPDQMMRPQMTELNKKVNPKYNQVARSGVSGISV